MKKYNIREEGTLDLWINMDGHEGKILTTYNGDNTQETICNEWDLNNVKNAEQLLDEFMGVLGRDIRNWHTMDIVLHWGVHTWKFVNNYNISEEDEF